MSEVGVATLVLVDCIHSISGEVQCYFCVLLRIKIIFCFDGFCFKLVDIKDIAFHMDKLNVLYKISLYVLQILLSCVTIVLFVSSRSCDFMIDEKNCRLCVDQESL